MLEEKKIIQFINQTENEDKIAKEIVKMFETKANKDNVEYSFDISKGVMQQNNLSANTYFVFDTEEETTIDLFKKYLFNEDLKDVKEKSKEEKDLLDLVRNFLLRICKKINDNYHDEIEKVIRNVVLGNKSDKETIPLDTIELIMIDIADYSSVPEDSKYLFNIFKNKNASPSQQIDTDEVISFLQSKKDESGMEYEEILEMEKNIGNPLFDMIDGIKKGRKFLNDITIYMFIDYSLNTSMQEKNNSE